MRQLLKGIKMLKKRGRKFIFRAIILILLIIVLTIPVNASALLSSLIDRLRGIIVPPPPLGDTCYAGNTATGINCGDPAQEGCYRCEGYNLIYEETDNYCGTYTTDADVIYQQCSDECGESVTPACTEYETAPGRQTSVFMWVMNSSYETVEGSATIPLPPGQVNLPRQPGGNVNAYDVQSCINPSDNRLLPSCFTNGWHDACLYVANDCDCFGDTLICMHYYYTNPDENVSTNVNAEAQCSSIINNNPNNNPRVWIIDGAYDGYENDTVVKNTVANEYVDISTRAEYDSFEGPQHCCGDDAPNKEGIYSDAGRLSDGLDDNSGGRFLCAQDINEAWQWLDKRTTAGNVYTINHGNYDALSTGITWVVCDAQEDDCTGSNCPNDASLGFPRESMEKEIKSSFWENMPSGGNSIKKNLDKVNINFQTQISSFICTEYRNYEGFFECAGDTTGRNANAPEKNNGDGYGMTLHTGNVVPIVDNFEESSIWSADVSDSSGSNNLYINRNNYIVSEGSNSLELTFDFYVDNNDTLSAFTGSQGITDWSPYYNDGRLDLEFDAYFNKNVDMTIQVINRDSNVFKRDLPIIDYSVDGTELNRWHHIMIPLDELYDETVTPLDQIQNIMFRMDGWFPNVQNKLYTSYIDGLSISAEKHYCVDFEYQDRRNFLWERDLDRSPDIDDGGFLFTTFRTLSACEKIPYADYTGSACCGDDRHEYYTEPYQSDLDSNEVINLTILGLNGVTIGGCWNSRIIENNTRVQPIKYMINGKKNETQMCTQNSCYYPLPHSQYLNNYTNGNQTIVNLNDEIIDDTIYEPYNVEFIGGGKSTSNENRQLIVNNIKWEVMNLDGRFYGCNANPILSEQGQTNEHGIQSDGSINSNRIIPDEFNYAQFGIDNELGPSQGRCQVKGEYYCSFDEGWSQDTYCEDDSNNGAAVSCIPLPAKQRDTTKNSPNILKNGGFETLDSLNQVPLNWNLDSDLSFEINNITTHSGSRSILGKNLQGAPAEFLSDFVQIEPGQDYTLSGWILNNFEDGNDVYLTYDIYNINKISISSGQTQNINVKNIEWNRTNITFRNNNGFYIRVGFHIPDANGFAFIDDMQLEIGKNITKFYESAQSYSCCPTDYCWNGNQCIESAIDEAAIDPANIDEDGFGYRCIEGSWTQQKMKYRWDKSDTGYCPTQHQCLVDSLGNAQLNNQPQVYVNVDKGGHYSENPQCIDNGQWIGDHFCDRGEWTTRTKLLALKMMQYVNVTPGIEKYTLFCDNYQNALNYDDYEVSGLPLIPTYIGFDILNANPECVDFAGNFIPCTNNFCVLKYWEAPDTTERQEMILVGTSLNQPLIGTTTPFNNTLPQSGSCAVAINANYDGPDSQTSQNYGNFISCSNDFIYYNNHTNSIVYSKWQYDFQPTVTDKIFDSIKNPLDIIIQFILKIIRKTEAGTNDFSYGYITQTSNFEKLYKHEQQITGNNKLIFGLVETVGDDSYMSINYEGFATDICNLVRLRAFQRPGASSSLTALGEGLVDCQPIINTTSEKISYLAVSKSVSGSGVWQDLTSKLRVATDTTRSAQLKTDITNNLQIISPLDGIRFDPGNYRINFRGFGNFTNYSSLYWDFETGIVSEIINGQGWGNSTQYKFNNVIGTNLAKNIRLIGIDTNGNFGYTNPITIYLNESNYNYPEVINNFPSQDQSDVNIFSQIVIEFDDLLVVDPGMITVTELPATAVSGTAYFTNVSGKTTLSWYPDIELNPSARYNITINQPNVRNTGNRFMIKEYSFEFDTSVLDNEAPLITSVSPPNGVIMNSTKDYECYYEFSEPTMISDWTGFTPTEITWYDNYRKLRTYPNSNAGNYCRLPNFADRNSNLINYLIHTTQGYDLTTPNVVNTIPVNNGIFTNTINFIFNEPVRFTHPGAILRQLNGENMGTYTIYPSSINGNNIEFRPSSLLDIAQYELTLFKASVRDYGLPSNYMDTDEVLIVEKDGSLVPFSFVSPSNPPITINDNGELIVRFNEWFCEDIQFTVTCTDPTDNRDQTDPWTWDDVRLETRSNIRIPGPWTSENQCTFTVNNARYSCTNPTTISNPGINFDFDIADNSVPTLVSIFPQDGVLIDNAWDTIPFGQIRVIFSEQVQDPSFGAIEVRKQNDATANYCPTWTMVGDATTWQCDLAAPVGPATYRVNFRNVRDLSGLNVMVPLNPTPIFTYVDNTPIMTALTVTGGTINNDYDTNVYSWQPIWNTEPAEFVVLKGAGVSLTPNDFITDSNAIEIRDRDFTYVHLYNDPTKLEPGIFNVEIIPYYICEFCDNTVVYNSALNSGYNPQGDIVVWGQPFVSLDQVEIEWEDPRLNDATGGDNSINLEWDPMYFNGFFYAINNGPTPTPADTTATFTCTQPDCFIFPSDDTSGIMTGLPPSTSYTIELYACNAYGCSDNSNSRYATTSSTIITPPAAPVSSPSLSSSSGTITLDWILPSAGEDSVNIYHSAIAPITEPCDVSGISTYFLERVYAPTETRDHNTDTSVSHYYKICTTNNAGNQAGLGVTLSHTPATTTTTTSTTPTTTILPTMIVSNLAFNTGGANFGATFSVDGGTYDFTRLLINDDPSILPSVPTCDIASAENYYDLVPGVTSRNTPSPVTGYISARVCPCTNSGGCLQSNSDSATSGSVPSMSITMTTSAIHLVTGYWWVDWTESAGTADEIYVKVNVGTSPPTWCGDVSDWEYIIAPGIQTYNTNRPDLQSIAVRVCAHNTAGFNEAGSATDTQNGV